MALKQQQLIFNEETGDCLRACVANLLELPIHTLPNDHSDRWWFVWRDLFETWGLHLQFGDACWQRGHWIASVPSLNYKCSHAILMFDQEVFFDPSTGNTYEPGKNMLGEDLVKYGYWIVVHDSLKIHLLDIDRKAAWAGEKTFF